MVEQHNEVNPIFVDWMRMRVESGIEKCVSLNLIYSRQFYAFKARLSALHLSGIKAMRKRQRRHIGSPTAAGFDSGRDLGRAGLCSRVKLITMRFSTGGNNFHLSPVVCLFSILWLTLNRTPIGY